jgi:hypothetical protein
MDVEVWVMDVEVWVMEVEFWMVEAEIWDMEGCRGDFSHPSCVESSTCR